MISLACLPAQRDNKPVLFNSGTGIGVPIDMADSRLAAIFTSVYNTIGASISMAGHGGSVLARAGSILPVRQSCHVPATPDWRRAGGFYTQDGVRTMPTLSRALSRLFPIAHNIGTAANLAEAQALARLHLARTGHAVRIAPAAVGFTVAEVR